MQYGKRCAVGVIADGIRLGILKLKQRVKAGELHYAVKLVLIYHTLCNFKKIIEIEEVFK